MIFLLYKPHSQIIFLTFSHWVFELITTTKIGPCLLIHFSHIKHIYNLIFYFLFEIKLLPNNNWTSLWIERIILKGKKQFLFCVYEHGNTRWTSLTRILNFPGQSTWTSFNKPFKLLFFYTFIFTWNAFLAVLELLVVFTMNFCPLFVYTSNYTQLKVGRHFLPF